MYTPVRFAAQHIDLPIAADKLSGTIWNGQLVFAPSHGVRWHLAEGESLRRLSPVFTWTLSGPQTELDGRIALRPRRVEIGPVGGTLDWETLAQILPGLPINCDMVGRVDAVVIDLGPAERRASGRVTTTAGQCMRMSAPDMSAPAPALEVNLGTSSDGIEAVLTTQADSTTALVTVRVTPADRVVLTIHRAGAALVPGMPDGADSELDLPLTTLMR